MNLYSEFFRFDIDGHLTAFIVSAANLIKRRKDTINLPSLASEVLKTYRLSAQDKLMVNELLSSAAAIEPSIMILRNKIFAHRSRFLPYKSAFKEAELTPNQLRDLTETILKLADRLLLAANLKTVVANSMVVSDARETLDALYKQHLAK